jgi:hypothetical protein
MKVERVGGYYLLNTVLYTVLICLALYCFIWKNIRIVRQHPVNMRSISCMSSGAAKLEHQHHMECLSPASPIELFFFCNKKKISCEMLML